MMRDSTIWTSYTHYIISRTVEPHVLCFGGNTDCKVSYYISTNLLPHPCLKIHMVYTQVLAVASTISVVK